jgi:vanillate O-demethylase monooxygenase subunit
MLRRPSYKPGLLQHKLWGSSSEKADGQGHVRWDAPSVLLALTGLNEVGQPTDQAVMLPSAHLLTPETDTTTHYFWASSRNRMVDDEALSTLIQTTVGTIFATQDGPMIAAEQVALGSDTDFMAHKPLILKADAAGMLARRVLKKLIKDEQETATGYIAVAK